MSAEPPIAPLKAPASSAPQSAISQRKRPVNEFLGLPYFYARERVLWARTFARNLGMGSYLAFVAGLVNSFAFLAFGTFVSHISGHATRMAVEYSEGHVTLAASFFLATALFVGGALTTTLLLGPQTLETRGKRFTLPLAIEFIALCYLISFQAGDISMATVKGSQAQTGAIYLLSFVMGLQNALIRQASGTIVRTTHMTGVATDIGIALGTALTSFLKEVYAALAREWELARSGRFRALSPTAVAKGVVRAFIGVFRYERLLLHVSVFVAFLLGAVVGTLGYIKYGFHILYCPVAILGIIIIRELQPRRHPGKKPTPHDEKATKQAA
jgi:uncharacterized membrane protein YoaK (UPF0700 family)